MNTRTAIPLVIALVAIPAFALTPVFFPPSPDMTPPPTQHPFYVVLGAIYALALGAGVAFLSFGLPLVRRLLPSAPGRAVAVYLTLGWLLVSWYPHGGLHSSNGMDTGRLLWIEYGFHLPLILAPLILIWAFTPARPRTPPMPPPEQSRPDDVNDRIPAARRHVRVRPDGTKET